MSKPLATCVALAVVLLLSTTPCVYASLRYGGAPQGDAIRSFDVVVNSTTYHILFRSDSKLQVLQSPASDPWIRDFVKKLDKASRRAAIAFGETPFTEVYVVDPLLNPEMAGVPPNAVVVTIVPEFRIHEAIEQLMRAYARRCVFVDSEVSWFVEGACSYGSKRIAFEELDEPSGYAKLYEDYLC